jgi:Ni/Co efflux regulator RcnB
MRHWVACCAFLLIATPTLCWAANCPPGKKCAPAPVQHQAPPPAPAPVIRQPSPNVGQQRAFVPNRPAPGSNIPQPRTFGSQGAPPTGASGPRQFGTAGPAPTSPGPRQFGTAGSAPASTEPRRFGTTGPALTSPGPRQFGTAGSAPTSTQSRRFGAVGPEHRPTGALGYRTANSLPRRAAGGHVYAYNGHSYKRFQAARYNWAPGYRYSRFEIGHAFPRQYWIHDYYIDDYADYGFAPPPPGYEWVRFGPDVLLISLTTGLISQAVYGAFEEDDSGPPDGYQDQSTADPGPPPGAN